MEDTEVARQLERVKVGDRSVLGGLLERHRARLERLVAFRLDRRVRGRIDEADVVQEAFLEAARRVDDYVRSPDMPFYLWLRFLALQRLQSLYREHLRARKRDVRREVSPHAAFYPDATSEVLAVKLLGKFTTPSQAAVRAEMKARLTEALESMESIDREVIALRHFEELGNAEVAQVLGLDESAASKRYIRAIKRLRSLLDTFSGISEAPR